MSEFMTFRFCLLFLLSLSACVNNFQKQGYVIDEAIVAKISIKTTNKQQVLQILGEPSTKSNYNHECFYYISLNTNTISYRNKEITAQDVLAITFDDKEYVSDISRYKTPQSHLVEISQEVTPTLGDDERWTKKLFGNVGKFNKKKKKK
jgi:outer membrane protein assembly factor BamE (lipoprotein component of BamABCDE complex)